MGEDVRLPTRRCRPFVRPSVNQKNEENGYAEMKWCYLYGKKTKNNRQCTRSESSKTFLFSCFFLSFFLSFEEITMLLPTGLLLSAAFRFEFMCLFCSPLNSLIENREQEDARSVSYMLLCDGLSEILKIGLRELVRLWECMCILVFFFLFLHYFAESLAFFLAYLWRNKERKKMCK